MERKYSNPALRDVMALIDSEDPENGPSNFPDDFPIVFDYIFNVGQFFV